MTMTMTYDNFGCGGRGDTIASPGAYLSIEANPKPTVHAKYEVLANAFPPLSFPCSNYVLALNFQTGKKGVT